MPRSDEPMVRTELWRMARFALTGVANTLAFVVTYVALLAAGLPYLAASALAYVTSVVVSYALNHRFTFRAQVHTRSIVARFVAIQGVAGAVDLGAIALLVEGAGWDRLPAQLVVIPPVVVVAFVLNRLWTFDDHVDTRSRSGDGAGSGAGGSGASPNRGRLSRSRTT